MAQAGNMFSIGPKTNQEVGAKQHREDRALTIRCFSDLLIEKKSNIAHFFS